jgi:hypothetical protein
MGPARRAESRGVCGRSVGAVVGVSAAGDEP